MSSGGGALGVENIQFNTDVLDLNDRINIDLSQFARSGFILPGTYPMVLKINGQALREYAVAFYPPEDDPKASEACLTSEIVKQFGLKEDGGAQLAWWRGGQCLVIESLPGMSASGDLASAALNVNIPQAYLEYSAINWDPPSRWDDGEPGLLIDYNMTVLSSSQKYKGTSNGLSGNGTVGANAGAWRLRADWQARIEGRNASNQQQRMTWSRYYAYRAIPSLRAKLVVGEDYLYSDLFDSFRFTGASLNSDQSQLPPNLRGYAPEVVGVAKTNARVIISQQGRVLYETLVAAGPFRIQDLNDAVSGSLDVRVEEQDGSVHTFQVETAGIPYLTRPGEVRYKLSTGRPSNLRYGSDGDVFGSGEFSWGISNGWSLFGGAIGDNNYRALSIGVGRDLLAFGAVSMDATQSHTSLSGEKLSGKSYRIQYSKNFDEYDSQVSFAGYRFSEKNFLSMSEYLDARYYGLYENFEGTNQYDEYGNRRGPVGGNKAAYTANFNKQFRDLGASIYLTYHRQTYWNRPDAQRWNVAVSRYFTLGSVKNMSMSLNMYHSQEYQHKDNGVTLSVSLPLGRSGTLTVGADRAQGKNGFSTRYSDRFDDRNSYQLSASDTSTSAYLSHTGDHADIDLSASTQGGDYSSLSLSARGGGTVTAQGGAFHRSGVTGGTRLMLDTGGVAGVPVRGYGAPTQSNAFGKAVISDISSYQRSAATVDLESLPANVEATQSVTQLTLTEGAIGYRTLDIISGEKAMAVLRLPDGTSPPFGATVKNEKQQDTGIVNDGGSVYLSGIHAGEQMTVSWGGAEQCTLTLPMNLPTDGLTDTLQLSCLMVGVNHSRPAPLTEKSTDTENTSS
ncbi:putative fimbrial outer membrane usher protein [Pseudomonas mucidolens]|nr:putative fimbrial outer membrane usher protein [Pseudomonas mucidolens]